MNRSHRRQLRLGRSRGLAAAAFTLLEMTLAIVILAIVMLGVQSAILMASRASPDRSGSGGVQLQTAMSMDQLTSDLSFATSFTVMSPSTVEFAVPDRNGDGLPDTIRYSWTGTAGDPLLRTLNGGSANVVTGNVKQFQLSYDRRAQQRSTTYSDSGEVLLSSYEGDSGLLGLGGLADAVITSSNFFGEYFKPTLPMNAAAWRLTRIKFKAHSDNPSGGLLGGLLGGNSAGGAGITRVQVRTIGTGGLPATILDEGTLAESTLGTSYVWQQFSFANATGRTPGSALCVVFQWSADAQACDIQYDSSASVANACLLKTTDGGVTWHTASGQELQFYFYGTYSTPDPIAYDYFLTSVRCALLSGGDSQRKLYTSARVLNEPQVPGP